MFVAQLPPLPSNSGLWTHTEPDGSVYHVRVYMGMWQKLVNNRVVLIGHFNNTLKPSG